MVTVTVEGEGATEQTEGEEQVGGEGEAVVLAPDSEELVVAIGKEPDATADTDAEIMAPDDTGQPPSTTLQNLRKKAREDAKALRQLEQERDAAIAAAAGKSQAAEPGAVVVGDKPTLETCDYDQAKLETELAAWLTRKSDAESQERKRSDNAKAFQAEYDARLNDYRSGSAQLKVANFKAAEDAVVGALSVVQQSLIINHAKNAALVVYALGNDAAKLKELAAIADPVKFALKARELESDIKTVKRQFKPEGKPPGGSGSGAPAVGGDALERARQKAATTGDYTEVTRLKREQRKSAQG